MFAVVVIGLLVVLVVLALGSVSALHAALQRAVERLDTPSPLGPGDTLYLNALGQLRECIVTAVDKNGVVIVRPIGPNLAADD